MKKIKSTVFVLLVLSLVLVSLPQIGVVKAQGTIYIREDGSVEGTNEIQRIGNVYSFMYNIFDSIIVERENVVIDGAGYQLQGNNSEYGIKLDSSGVTIKNMKISNFNYGIYVYLSSHNNIIVNNDINGNSRGIYVRGTSNNTITGNNITNNSDGIYLSGTDNVLKNNQMENNSYNFGITPQSHSNDIDISNTVDGKPIYYWTNRHDSTVPLDAGCVILIDCTNIKVQNLTLTNNNEGILIVSTKNSEIKNCNSSKNKKGIRLLSSSNVNVTQNIFSENREGVSVWESTNVIIDENQITDNVERGIYFFDSKNFNIISDNHITGSSEGIHIGASSNNNTITGNTITTCNQAILFTISSYNTLRNNSMYNNENYFRIEHDHYTDASREIPYLINDIDSTNTIDGKPMYYWINQQDKTIPSNAGYVVLMKCTNITVSNLQDVSAVLVAFTNDSLISQNRIENSNIGIKIWRGSNNSIVANYANSNEFGLSIFFSGRNDVYWNIVSNNVQGITLSGPSGNHVFRNIISNNINGIYLDWTDNNTIYNNNFIDNTRHVYDATETIFPFVQTPSSNHNWNQTYPIGGNYWSNFTGVDLKSGKNQNLTGSDGIIDIPFVLYTNNTDRYPLANPIIFFNVGIWEWKQYFVNCVSNSTLSDFYFNPLEGAFIRFNATGENTTTGFCRVIIPKGLLDSQNGWNVIINGESITTAISEDSQNSYIYFTYNHSTKTIEIIGTEAIPEFPSWIVLPLLIAGTLVVTIVRNKLVRKKLG